MKYLRMFGLMVAAMALMAVGGAGSASATVACKTSITSGCGGTAWSYGNGTTMHITQETGQTGVLQTTGGTVLDTCTGGTMHGAITSAGGASSTVRFSTTTIDLGTCTRTSDTIGSGNEVELHHESGTDNATVTYTGNSAVTINTIVGTCIYGLTSGALDWGKYTGAAATFDTNLVLPKDAGNFACPDHAVWSTSYELTAPAPMYISAS